MNVLVSTIYPELNIQNKLFDPSCLSIGFDILAPYALLWSLAADHGIYLYTPDLLAYEDADACLFVELSRLNLPLLVSSIRNQCPRLLIAMESPSASSFSHSPAFQQLFQFVYSWAKPSALSLQGLYRKLSYAVPSTSIASPPFDLRKFASMIASNKRSSHPSELYSLRRQIIGWYYAHYPTLFDLYGHGWNRPACFTDSNPLVCFAKLASCLRRPFYRSPASFVGSTPDKRITLGSYKFSFCFENIASHDDYLTEKIFDCLLAKTIPIYYGAPNIGDLIPASCFIDFRAFDSFRDLHDFLVDIDERTYCSYLQSASEFLESASFTSFSPEAFASNILEGLIELSS